VAKLNFTKRSGKERKSKDSKKASSGTGVVRALVVTALLLFAGLVFCLKYVYSSPTPGEQVSLDALARLSDKSQVVSAKFLDEDATVTGVYCTTPTTNRQCVGGAKGGEKKEFWTSYPHSDATTSALISSLSKHALVTVDSQADKAMLRFFAQFLLPLLILANLFGIIFLARGKQSGLSDIAGFGGMRRGRQREKQTDTSVTFANVAGAEEAVAELREVKDYLTDPDRYKAFGAQPPKGVLLFGAPGCGKTLLARAVAGESKVPFFSISGAEFVESLVGVGAARVRDLFRQVREVAPAIVFIDELDAAGRRRTGEGASGGEREQTLNQLLVEMDGFEVSSGIVVMGATNRPDILDPALLRPGRFDRHVTLEQPDIHGRKAILELHATGKPLVPGIDFAHLARSTPGFTGADLASVINEGALLAIREGHADIRMEQLQEAIQRVLSGPRRRGHLLSSEERQRVAYHEAGHALVAAGLGRLADIQRVSIVARGRGLGQSIVSSDADRSLHTRTDIENQMTMAMGGICSEQLRFGEPSTAGEDDNDKVSELARQMVGRHGMSPVLGNLRLLASDADIYLGGTDGSGMVGASPQTLEAFDHEVMRFINEARTRATELLGRHRPTLDQLAALLDRQETVEGPDLVSLLRGVHPGSSVAPPPPTAPPSINGGGSPHDAAALRSRAREAR